MRKYKKILLLLIFFLTFTVSAKNINSGLRFPSERLVFDHDSKGISFLLKNNDNNSYLVQADIAIPDETSGIKTKEKLPNMPFIITPPLYRIDAKSEYSWQIKKIANLKMLPQDRESVFFIKLKAIPPKGTKNTINFKNGNGNITLSKVLHYKFYYRPESLKNIKLNSVKNKLSFTLNGNELIAKNSSPIYLTLGELVVGQHKVDNLQLFKMIPPFGEQIFQLPPKKYDHSLVKWKLLNESMLEMPEQTQKL